MMAAPRGCQWSAIAHSASLHACARQRQHLLRCLRCINGHLRRPLGLSSSVALTSRTKSAWSPPAASFSTAASAPSVSAPSDSESFSISSFRRSVLYLLSRRRYAAAMSLFSAHPQLHTVELTLLLAARLHADGSTAAYSLSLLLRLHSHGLLPITAAEQHFKQAVLRGDVVAAHSLLPVLFPASCLPSAATAASVSSPSPLVRMAAVAQLCLLQCWSVLRMRQLTAGGVTQPVLRPSASHASFPLAAHAEAVERERQAAKGHKDPAAQLVPEGWASEPADGEEAQAARRLLQQELFAQQELRPQDWPPLLLRCQARAMEWRRAGVSAAEAELFSASPLHLLSPHLESLPLTSPSSGTDGVSLLDCLLLTEHLRLLASLHSDPRFLTVWRYRASCSVMLNFHLAVLVVSEPAAARACALLDAQLAIQARLDEARRPRSALSLLSLDLVLASWAALLAAHPSTSAPSFRLPERYGYQTFLSSFSAALMAVSSSSHPALWPTSETYSALVSASLSHPQLMAATRVGEWVRALLNSREKKGSVMSPQLLLMEGAARHLQLIREETSRAALSGLHQHEDTQQSQQQQQQDEEQKQQLGDGRPDWRLVMQKAERGDRAACHQLLGHYRQHFDASRVVSSSPWSPLSFSSSSHDAFALLFRCATVLTDVETGRLLWRHALRLHPHPPAELSSAFFLCLGHCQLALDAPATVNAPPPSLPSPLPAAACPPALPSPPASLLSLLQLYLSFSPPPTSRKLSFRPQSASSSLLLLLLVRCFLSRSRPFTFAFTSQPRVEVEQLRRRALLLLEGRGGEDRVRELARELRDAMLRRAWEDGDAAAAVEATAAAAEASAGWDDRLRADDGEEREADAQQQQQQQQQQEQFPQLAFEHLRLPLFPISAHLKQRIHRRA